MRLDVVSLTPEAFAPLQGLGVIGRANELAQGVTRNLPKLERILNAHVACTDQFEPVLGNKRGQQRLDSIRIR